MKCEDSVVFIDDLRLYAFHGVLPQERRVGGWYRVSLRVHYNIYNAMQSDCVDDTLNYADLCALVRSEMALPSQLVEHVAGRIAQRVFEQFPQSSAVDVRVTKENPPMSVDCAGAGVELHLINNKN